MLTTKAKYGLRALRVLAAAYPANRRITTATIAAEEQIPHKFLEIILLELKQSGFLTSKRGPDGGYALARPPHQIFMGQVIRVLDGPLAPTPCVSREQYQPCADCPDEQSCAIRAVMGEVRDAIASVLDCRTIEDLAEAGRKMNGGEPPMYYI